MRDAIAAARNNTPAVALVTTKFFPQGDFVARSAGMPDVPRVILPHPVAGTGEKAMKMVADDIADEVLRALGAAG